VERHALADGERVGQAVLGDQAVVVGRHLGGQTRHQVGPVRADLQQPLIGLQDHGLAALTWLDLCGVQRQRFIVGGVDEGARLCGLTASVGGSALLAAGRGVIRRVLGG
jgi:hypothetical protein